MKKLLAFFLLISLSAIAQPLQMGSAKYPPASSSFSYSRIASSSIGQLNLESGTAAYPPLKFNEGTLVASITPGALEFYNHALYFTTYLVRRTVNLAQNVVETDVTIQATTTETIFYSAPMAPNFLTVGKVAHIKLRGQISLTAAGGATAQIFLSHNGTHIATSTVPAGLLASQPFHFETMFTCRSTGVSGTFTTMSDFETPTSTDAHQVAKGTIDTTATSTLTLSIQYSSNNAANVFQLQQGWTESVH